MGLADNKCVPCRGGVPPMERAKAEEMLKQLARGWSLNKEGHLERLYTFKDFAQALAFVNKVGAVAEAEGHHPDLYLAWGKCKVERSEERRVGKECRWRWSAWREKGR